MKVELHIETTDPARVEAQAEAAEATGADAVVTAETFQDAMLPLMSAARATHRVKLATGIVVAFPRSPMVTALQSSYLHQYSGGRFELGLGSQVKGHIQRRYSTEWVPPGPRMRDYVLSLRAIWESWRTGTSPNYVGSHYAFTLGTNSAPRNAGLESIPVSIAAVNPYMLRLAGEICEGVRLHHFCSRRHLEGEVAQALARGVALRSSNLPPLDVSGGGFIVAGRDGREVHAAREAVRRQVSFYGSTRTYESNFSVYGWKDLTAELHEMSLRKEWDRMPSLISDEILDEFAVAGTYDEVVAGVKRRFLPHVNRVSMSLRLETSEDVDNATMLVRQLQALLPQDSLDA